MRLGVYNPGVLELGCNGIMRGYQDYQEHRDMLCVQSECSFSQLVEVMFNITYNSAACVLHSS